ncbi:hypothetical protein O988_05273 [Pseudogymnoascus sp. VKM F-3808]|nr:hypothetical protein O988_05273 [Pseudogymnoascus sp. VKM F-3808]
MSSPQTNLIIIGAGVVGSALAHTLSSNPSLSITVLSPPSHTTSTSLAPGLVGQLNALPALTTLAKTSVKAYLTLPPGAFSAVGGLEIASTPEGIEILEERLKLAHAAGLEAKLLSSDEAAKLAPQFVKPDEISKGLYFPTDGVAEPSRIVDAFQSSALANGATFLPTTALSIQRANGIVTGVTTPTGTLPASKVIVATGIWSPALLEDLLHLPVIPVAHPYLHGPSRAVREKESPFVRWPEKGVYARDHGECDGFGTYEHVPVAVPAEESAKKEWDGRFDGAVGRADRMC